MTDLTLVNLSRSVLYLKKRGLTSDKDEVDYLKRIDPSNIDDALKELGVTPNNLALVIEDFEKYLDVVQKTTESYQKLFKGITSIQDSFSHITKGIYDNATTQLALSKAVQNLIPLTQLAPDMKDYLSKLAIHQSDLAKLISQPPQVGVLKAVDWPKLRTHFLALLLFLRLDSLQRSSIVFVWCGRYAL